MGENSEVFLPISTEPVTLWAKEVSAHVGNQVILGKSSLTCRSGQVTAILGPSGAGKTTLLNILTGRLRKYEGSVGINDQCLSDAVSKYLVNYVMAHDRFNEYLTVEETLFQTARLRNPHRSDEDNKATTLHLLEQLNILHCSDTLVGGTWRKGISKGETKRLAVACELVGNPCVLVLDEPTTGLDSSISFELIKILKTVAKEKNLVVLCTLHQPSQRIFELFDSLIVMGGAPGSILYQGTPANALPYFASVGYIPADKTASIPDSLLDIVSGAQSTEEGLFSQLDSEDIAANQASMLLPSFRPSQHRNFDVAHHESSSLWSASVHLHGGGVAATKSPGSSTHLNKRQSINGMRRRQIQPEGNFGPLPHLSEIDIITNAQSWGTQFRIVFLQYLKSNFRNPLSLLVIGLVNIVQALILGCLFWAVDSDMKTVTTPDYTTWSIFNAPAIQYFIHGISNVESSTEGVVEPLTQFFGKGINEANGASVVWDMAGNPDIIDWLVDTMKCVRRHTKYDDSVYPPWDYTSQPTTSWGSAFDDGLTKSDVCWNDIHKFEHTTSKLWSMEQVVTFISAGLQTLDMYMAHTETITLPVGSGGAADLVRWAMFQSQLTPHIDMALCCGGVPRAFDDCSTFLKGEKRVFPGRMYWPEFVQEVYPQLRQFLADPEIREYLISKLRGARKLIAQATEVRDASELVNVVLTPLRDIPAPALLSGSKRRKLGSGVGGIVTDLIKLLTSNPNSPIYKIIVAAEALWDRIVAPDCQTRYCGWLQDAAADANKIGMDLFTSFLTVLNICSIIFFLVANLGFASYDVLLQFPKIRAIFNRERASGMYRTSSFLLGKMCADLPFHIIFGLVWSIVYYYMVGLERGTVTVFKFLGVAVLITFAAYSMGYLISSIVLRLETSIVLSPLILVAMLVLAGFFIRDAEMPGWIAWARYLSIYRWGYFAVQLVQFPPGGSYGSLPNGLALMLAGVTDQSLTRVCLYLLAISIGCRVASYFALSFLHTNQGVEA